MSAGGSAAEMAAAARRRAEQKQREAERAAQLAAAWDAGRAGEERVAEIIASMEPAGFLHLHDRALPGSSANIDHIVVGPPGVFIIDAKAWTGTLTIEHGVLRQEGRARRREVEASRSAAQTVADAVEDLLATRVDVRPALCFVGEAQLATEHFVDRVKLINGDDVTAWMQRFEAKLTADDIARVHAHLADALPAKTGERPPAEYDSPPDEIVVYLFPWKKAGQSRLYVRSNDGLDVGYLDLVSGRVSSPSGEWEEILVQLLPHYVSGDAAAVGSHQLSNDAQSALRRFIDRVLGRAAGSTERRIIACYRWRNYGLDRLYLNRLLPGGRKTDLGFFDLDTGLLKTKAPGATSVLGYCGQRFRQLELGRA